MKIVAMWCFGIGLLILGVWSDIIVRGQKDISIKDPSTKAAIVGLVLAIASGFIWLALSRGAQ